ncbi:MAG: hypothetical protein VKJ24_21800 [Synechococcales bacterium]|nr:hypothetical protein [Synechococcales bacterium]
MQEQIDMRGEMMLYLSDRQGNIIHRQSNKNRIVKTGRRLVAELFAGVTGTPPAKVTHMGIGTGEAAATDEQAQLVAPREPRKAIATPQYEEFNEPVTGGGVIRRIKVKLSTEFDFNEGNGNEPLREAGIFNAATGGVMYNRVTFQPVTKTDAFKLTLLWEIIF